MYFKVMKMESLLQYLLVSLTQLHKYDFNVQPILYTDEGASLVNKADRQITPLVRTLQTKFLNYNTAIT